MGGLWCAWRTTHPPLSPAGAGRGPLGGATSLGPLPLEFPPKSTHCLVGRAFDEHIPAESGQWLYDEVREPKELW